MLLIQKANDALTYLADITCMFNCIIHVYDFKLIIQIAGIRITAARAVADLPMF